MVLFCGWGLTASRLEPLQGDNLLFTTLSTSEEWKAESTLETPSGFEQDPWIGNLAP